jgi:hypothetical protein
VRRLFLTCVASCLFACGPGGSGGSGDPPSDKPIGNPYGTGERLSQILGPATWLDPSDMESTGGCPGIPFDRAALVTGVSVVGIDDYDETGGGALGNYYVEDVLPEPIAFSGVTVFDPGFSPPDLRVARGDVVDIFGQMTEFIGPSSGRFGFCRTLPEMSGAMEFRFEAPEMPAVKIDVADLATYEGGRQWLGMLVEVDNVVLLEDPYDPGTGRYSIRIDAGSQPEGEELPSIVNELFDLKTAYPDMQQGDTITRVRGVVTYFYGMHLAPRSADDITP